MDKRGWFGGLGSLFDFASSLGRSKRTPTTASGTVGDGDVENADINMLKEEMNVHNYRLTSMLADVHGLDHADPLACVDDSDLVSNLGFLLGEAGIREIISCLEEAESDFNQNDEEFLLQRADRLSLCAKILNDCDSFDKAELCANYALTILEDPKCDQTSPEHKDRLATVFSELGSIHKRQGKLGRPTEQELLQSLTLFASQDPSRPRAIGNLATALNNLADFHLSRGDFKQVSSKYYVQEYVDM